MVLYRNGKNLRGVYAMLDDHGRGRADGVPPGLQSLRFQADGFELRELDVRVGLDMAAVRVELVPAR